ncbi:ubiquinol-cytochrome c reductase iron-sulfur subunit N-terminal domain-containing protein [Parasulfitobacter algicola]|uniref:Twin-arginine translocation signal domain-containing protein n=1 Tax=Parasulfitobacter algicola TaxID=2614809 RepID=A0ABX2IU86_9RHOB|nr:ubiquinol-cytochrome c reductase iron-sulfur subunit N-terminal domain-containing protein [Sulfitobacter algicola]NSX55571.1 twin-arginine translocation signal domain-containing protein [Sulfitobacter algicola]
MSKSENEGKSRRDFLKLASTAAPAAVAAAALTGAPAQAAETVTDETLMQDTAHTRAYFDSARF